MEQDRIRVICGYNIKATSTTVGYLLDYAGKVWIIWRQRIWCLIVVPGLPGEYCIFFFLHRTWRCSTTGLWG